jgi:hypothetical protein
MSLRIDLLPGADLVNTRRILDDARMGAINNRNERNPEDLLFKYLQWARTYADMLYDLIRPAQTHDLLLTPTYWALLTSTSAGRGITLPTIHAEYDSRKKVLEAAIAQLDAERERWSLGFGPIVVLDTGIFIEHELDFPDSLASIEDRIAPADPGSTYAGGSPVQFVIPLQVIDELDKTKADRSRGRARIALARLNEVFTSPLSAATVEGLRAGSAVHLLMDDPGHVRLPIEDDEIVERALYLDAVSTGTRGSVGVACMDTGMDLRVRVKGLTSYLIPDRRPDPAHKQKAQRAAATPHASGI